MSTNHGDGMVLSGIPGNHGDGMVLSGIPGNHADGTVLPGIPGLLSACSNSALFPPPMCLGSRLSHSYNRGAL